MTVEPDKALGAGSVPPENIVPISLESISNEVFPKIEEHLLKIREDARNKIALMIVGSLCGIVLFSFITLWVGKPIADIKEILEILISPVIGIVGAVTGFYFGEKVSLPTATGE
jgi:hypothetical protein